MVHFEEDEKEGRVFYFFFFWIIEYWSGEVEKMGEINPGKGRVVKSPKELGLLFIMLF